ncbi:type II toxin-antitoxin system Phd/YefM family antitoxin [Nostoc sp.]|uniref:type II toxin-antitoxin system Phd/YefM family antitoxin n=2 Tax=Nostoc sp. TaxID=1180 RepID=UPI002FF65ACF
MISKLIKQCECKSLRKAMKKVTLTELSNNIERLLDEVLETGIPLEINKNGKLLKIVPIEKKDKLKNLTLKSDAIQGNPGDLVNISWEQEINIDLS